MATARQLFNISRELKRDTGPNYATTGAVSASITRTNPIHRTRFGLTGALTVTGSNGITALGNQGAFHLIDDFKIVANSGVTLFQSPGDLLYHWSVIDNEGGRPHRVDPALATAGNQPYEINWNVDYNPRTGARVPDYMSLADYSDESGGKDLRAVFQFASSRAAFYTPGASVTVADGTTPFVSILSEVITDGPLHEEGGKRGMPGDRGGRVPYNPKLYRVRNIETQSPSYNGAQTDLKVPLQKGLFHRRLIIQTKASGVVVDTILNSIRIQMGSVTLGEASRKELFSRQKERYIQDEAGVGLWTGVTVIDLADFVSEQQIDTEGDFKVLLDVANVSGGAIRVSTERYLLD